MTKKNYLKSNKKKCNRITKKRGAGISSFFSKKTNRNDSSTLPEDTCIRELESMDYRDHYGYMTSVKKAEQNRQDAMNKFLKENPPITYGDNHGSCNDYFKTHPKYEKYAGAVTSTGASDGAPKNDDSNSTNSSFFSNALKNTQKRMPSTPKFLSSSGMDYFFKGIPKTLTLKKKNGDGSETIYPFQNLKNNLRRLSLVDPDNFKTILGQEDNQENYQLAYEEIENKTKGAYDDLVSTASTIGTGAVGVVSTIGTGAMGVASTIGTGVNKFRKDLYCRMFNTTFKDYEQKWIGYTMKFVNEQHDSAYLKEMFATKNCDKRDTRNMKEQILNTTVEDIKGMLIIEDKLQTTIEKHIIFYYIKSKSKRQLEEMTKEYPNYVFQNKQYTQMVDSPLKEIDVNDFNFNEYEKLFKKFIEKVKSNYPDTESVLSDYLEIQKKSFDAFQLYMTQNQEIIKKLLFSKYIDYISIHKNYVLTNYTKIDYQGYGKIYEENIKRANDILVVEQNENKKEVYLIVKILDFDLPVLFKIDGETLNVSFYQESYEENEKGKLLPVVYKKGEKENFVGIEYNPSNLDINDEDAKYRKVFLLRKNRTELFKLNAKERQELSHATLSFEDDKFKLSFTQKKTQDTSTVVNGRTQQNNSSNNSFTNGLIQTLTGM